ncbi:MAG: RluA family pseudouridine synthase [Candidatus Omnitrophota bacterium]
MRSCVIGEDGENVRLDVYLTQMEPDFSRTFVKDWILEGKVLVNGQKVKPHYKLKPEDELQWETLIQEKKGLEPEDIPLTILHEDDDLIVVDKPAGMVVHPGAGNEFHTLVHALLHHCGELSEVSALRPGIVHRLDKDTSGVMVAAKNNKAHFSLAKQFKQHTIERRYIALVEGLISFDEGVVDVPIKRHVVDRKKMSVSFAEDAKEANTFYRVLKRYQDYTALELFPQTGRTHQLRVHLSYLGHPILGDPVYGRKKNFPRLALHAKDLGFEHPTTKEFMKFSSPLPEDLKKATPDINLEAPRKKQ